jgi:hypothetical protein
MSTEATPHSQVVEGLSGVLVGGGIITMALFPLAVPLIALTLIAAIPVLLITLAAALAVAAVIVPVLLVLGLGRRAIRAASHTSAASSRLIHDQPVRRLQGGTTPDTCTEL